MLDQARNNFPGKLEVCLLNIVIGRAVCFKGSSRLIFKCWDMAQNKKILTKPVIVEATLSATVIKKRFKTQ